METSTYDVIIVGGGPSGASAGCYLGRKGYRVLILEKERFPRPHIGESLVRGVIDELAYLGLLDRIERAGFMPKHGSSHAWGGTQDIWDLWFRADNPTSFTSYNVERAEFDRIILDAARESGAEVHEGSRVTDVVVVDGRVRGVRWTELGSERRSALARCVIDASGQARVVAKRMGVVSSDGYFGHNWAVYGYWRGADFLPGMERTNLFFEAFDGGWFWFIPLHNGTTSVGAVIGRDSLPAIRERGRQSFYLGAIRRTTHVSRLLRDAELDGDATVVREYSFNADRFCGPGYFLVGDAGTFTDPLWSSGLFLALRSGRIAAGCVDAIAGDRMDEESVLDFYKRHFRLISDDIHEVVRLVYNGHTVHADAPFWRERRTSPERLGVSPQYLRTSTGARSQNYERRFLQQLPLPEQVRAEIEAHDRRFLEAWRRNWGDSVPPNIDYDLMQRSRPRLAPGTYARREPALHHATLDWGYVLRSPTEQDGYTVFPPELWELLAPWLAGEHTVAEITRVLVSMVLPEHEVRARLQLTALLRDLYLEELIEPASAPVQETQKAGAAGAAGD